LKFLDLREKVVPQRREKLQILLRGSNSAGEGFLLEGDDQRKKRQGDKALPQIILEVK